MPRSAILNDEQAHQNSAVMADECSSEITGAVMGQFNWMKAKRVDALFTQRGVESADDNKIHLV